MGHGRYRRFEPPDPRRRLRYLHPPPYRLRRVAAVEKPGPDLRQVLLQVAAQFLDGYAIEAKRPFVAPHTRQRLRQIAGLIHCLHRRSLPGRRVFGVGTRHASFGPSVSEPQGFTLHHRLQGQFQLDFRPLGSHEHAVLMTLSIVQTFAGAPAMMPSADFCAALTSLAAPLSPGIRVFRTRRRPPEVRLTAFTAHPPDLPPRPLTDMDFAVICPLVRPGRPRIRFLSIGSRLCSTLPSDPAATTPSRFANPSPPSGWIEDGLAPPSCQSCSAHKKKGGPTPSFLCCAAEAGRE